MVVANPPLPVLVEGLGVLLGSGGVVRTVNPLSSTATFATREPRDQVLFKRSMDCTILHPRFPSFPFPFLPISFIVVRKGLLETRFIGCITKHNFRVVAFGMIWKEGRMWMGREWFNRSNNSN